MEIWDIGHVFDAQIENKQNFSHVLFDRVPWSVGHGQIGLDILDRNT